MIPIEYRRVEAAYEHYSDLFEEANLSEQEAKAFVCTQVRGRFEVMGARKAIHVLYPQSTH